MAYGTVNSNGVDAQWLDEPATPAPGSAESLAQSLHDMQKLAKQRLDYINHRRNLLQAEIEEAVGRYESERDLLARLIRGLETALGHPEASQPMRSESRVNSTGSMLSNV